MGQSSGFVHHGVARNGSSRRVCEKNTRTPWRVGRGRRRVEVRFWHQSARIIALRAC